MLEQHEHFMTEPWNARAVEFFLDEPVEEPGEGIPSDYEEEPVAAEDGGRDPDDEAKQLREQAEEEQLYSHQD